jgi:SAM-dependent methyltransferase
MVAPAPVGADLDAIMGIPFKDHFSGHASAYQAYRPTYPDALFAWLAREANATTAIDLGCGNGQAACGLAGHVPEVIALDPSAEQIRQATPHPRVTYAVAPAEATGLPAAGADLILAAQAFHWFDHARFFPELRRIARPGALFAAVTYATCSVTPPIDQAVHALYHDLLDAYWPPERRHVESGYRSLPFPFAEVAAPAFAIVEAWTLERFRGYLGTWSALKAYERQHGVDPRTHIDASLLEAWGDPAQARAVTWPISIRAGRVG